MGRDLASLGERIRSGDPAAEADFAGIYRDRIFSMMLARTGSRDSARDLTQEALLATLEALRDGHLRSAGSLGAFVHGTARNILNGFFRAQARRPREVPLPDELPAEDPGNPVEDAERLALVRRALDQLDPTDSAILRMTLVEGLGPGEIASRLKLRTDLVRARKSRAIKKLVKHVRELSRGDGARPPVGGGRR